jgi:hypothetical protein
VALHVLSGHWCPSEMLRRGSHGAKELCQVAVAQAAHAHTMERLGATEAHVRQVAGGVVLHPLSARHLSGASVVANSGTAVAAIAAGGTSMGGDGIGCKKGGHMPSTSMGPAVVVAQERVLWCCTRISPASGGAGAEELAERGQV